jgi:hypothetical protein
MPITEMPYVQSRSSSNSRFSRLRLVLLDHGFCEGCISKWFEIRGGSGATSGRLSCPECREPADRSHLTPLFLDIVVLDNDSESQSHTSNTQVCLDTSISNHATFVMNGLGRIGPQSEASSFVRAGKEIEKVVDAVKNNASASNSHYEMIEVKRHAFSLSNAFIFMLFRCSVCYKQ